MTGNNEINVQYEFSDTLVQNRAQKLNCTIEYADDHTLQLDIDSEEAFRNFQCRHATLCNHGLPLEAEYSVRPSSGGNRHVNVRLKKPLPILERILLQALLASDITREMLCYARLKSGNQNPVLLFRPDPAHHAPYPCAGGESEVPF